jgi:hypothetical protein
MHKEVIESKLYFRGRVVISGTILVHEQQTAREATPLNLPKKFGGKVHQGEYGSLFQGGYL